METQNKGKKMVSNSRFYLSSVTDVRLLFLVIIWYHSALRTMGKIQISDTKLGSSCERSEQCKKFVASSHCDEKLRVCRCQPYFVEYDNNTCVPASLLGFECVVDEQCSFKVPNSYCENNKCLCKPGFLPFRLDKCLPPAKVDDYCLNDEQCHLASKNSFCKYIIPRIYGICQCPFGYLRTDDRRCLPALFSACEADEECMMHGSFCKQRGQDSTCSCTEGFLPSGNGKNCEPIPTEEESTILFEKEEEENNIERENSDIIISLGKICQSDRQCQARDPYTSCIDGICQCISSSSRCSSQFTGCLNDTFQCKSGQCVSWFFVCDGQNNCLDGSDEEECTSTRCAKEAFQCNDGTCLPRTAVCNGKWECPDGSDEARCYKGISCDKKAFQCDNGECLPQYAFCNVIKNCADGSDEKPDICSHSETCPTGTFQCDNGHCRSTAILCSGLDGCGDNSDEERCEVCYCDKP
ncbi:uncharacterized protein LOC143234998 isoform X1 [Tachypleus tridentatus]|uniref:uncharacterized protein LOC143234998 isoform X1 n=2 Tax=Tachypleus tridentatus TaxID=6853 RepID=UPI003FD1A8B6